MEARARATGAQPDGAQGLSLILYTGKGGVGKTTTAAATGLRAASQGSRTLVVSADPAHSLGDVLGVDLSPLPTAFETTTGEDQPLPVREVSSKLFAVELDARVEVRRQWARIHDYLARLFAHHGIEESVARELATLPGAYELAALLCVDRAVRSGAYDLVVVDCAPTASALRMTSLPDVARGALRVALGVLRLGASLATPVAQRLVDAPLPGAEVFESVESLLYRQLSALRRRLLAASTAVRLVVTPERMVLDEALRAYTDLRLFELGVDAVVCNRVLPDPADPEAGSAGSGGEDSFYRALHAAQAPLRDEIAAAFAPLPVLEAPFQQEEVVGLERLGALGEALFGAHPPASRLAPPTAGLHFVAAGDEVLLRLSLPGLRPDEVDVAKVEGLLVVTTERRRRALPLPRRVARLDLVRASLQDELLEVAFAMPGGSRCG